MWFATETVDSGSIPLRVKPKSKSIGIAAFLLDLQQLKGQCQASTVCGNLVDRWQLDSKTERFFPLLPAGQGNFANENAIAIKITLKFFHTL